MKFSKSKNELVKDILVASHGTNGGTLNKSTGTAAIANTAPVAISPTDLKALLIANGITATGGDP